MERVRQAQAGDVVAVGEGLRIAVASSVGAQPRQRRFEVRRTEQRQARDAVCRRQVLLHQHRRQRQHVGDVVEPVARVVLREVVGGPRLHAEQIADGVVVFGTVEPAGGYTSRIGRRFAVDPIELLFQPGRDCLSLRFLRLVLLDGRHFLALELPGDLFPALTVLDERGRIGELLEVQILFVLLVAVTAVAVLGKEWCDQAVEPGSRRLRRRCALHA